MQTKRGLPGTGNPCEDHSPHWFFLDLPFRVSYESHPLDVGIVQKDSLEMNEALNHWATCEFIPQEELLAGELGPYLKRLMEKEPNWPALSLNGAQVAAQEILDLLKRD